MQGRFGELRMPSSSRSEAGPPGNHFRPNPVVVRSWRTSSRKEENLNLIYLSQLPEYTELQSLDEERVRRAVARVEPVAPPASPMDRRTDGTGTSGADVDNVWIMPTNECTLLLLHRMGCGTPVDAG